jgi:hypothetical protein
MKPELRAPQPAESTELVSWPSLGGPIAALVALWIAMSLGLAEFPAHGPFVVAALVLVHASASMVVAVFRLEQRRMYDLLWRDRLTLRLSMEELARRTATNQAVKGDLDLEQIWSSAALAAREDVESHLARQDPFARPWLFLLADLVVHLVGLAALYGVILIMAIAAAKFL